MLTLYCKQFFINPVNKLISHNSVPTFNYKCVLLITYNPDNMSNNYSMNTVFLVCASPILPV